MNTQQISQYLTGKYNIDISKLSNEDKIRFVRIENLLKALIDYFNKTKKLMLEFDEGHEVKENEIIERMVKG